MSPQADAFLTTSALPAYIKRQPGVDFLSAFLIIAQPRNKTALLCGSHLLLLLVGRSGSQNGKNNPHGGIS